MLCSVNCGLEVRLDGRSIARVRGDKAHPGSLGYTCEKGLRIDHYQSDPQRLTSPLRRRPDGTFEEIDWDTAIAEVAARFRDVIDEHGGDKILYYGGGGQGNHLGGGYGASTRAALGIRYHSNALAQEKTGEFWVDGQLFGRSRCHTTGDYEHAQVAVFWGKNPWQSHGFPQARRILKEIANDPDRTLIVVDPRRTESADLADIHLRPRPGGDADLLSALLAVLVEEQLLADRWLAEHANGLDEVLAHLRRVDIAAACAPRRRRRGRGAPCGTRDRPGDRWRVDLRGPRDPDGAALDAQQLPREVDRAAHRQLRRAGRDEPAHPDGIAGFGGGARAGRRRAGHPRHRAPARDRARAVQRDPRRDPRRPPRPLPGDARRVRQPRPLAGRQPAHARGAAARSSSGRDRRRPHRDRAPGALRAAGRVAVREVGVHVLQPRVPAQRVPAPAARCSSRCPARLPEYEIHARLCRALGAYSDDDLAPLREAADRGPRRVTPRRSSTLGIAAARARPAGGGHPLRDARADPRLPRWRSCCRRGGALGARPALRAGVPRLDPPRRHR